MNLSFSLGKKLSRSFYCFRPHCLQVDHVPVQSRRSVETVQRNFVVPCERVIPRCVPVPVSASFPALSASPGPSQSCRPAQSRAPWNAPAPCRASTPLSRSARRGFPFPVSRRPLSTEFSRAFVFIPTCPTTQFPFFLLKATLFPRHYWVWRTGLVYTRRHRHSRLFLA